MSNWQDISVALVSALTGGGFIKIMESWLTRNKNKSEQDKQFRDELRAEAEGLRKQLDKLKDELRQAEKELDDFKEKYWKIYTEYQQFKLSVYGILLQNGIKPADVLPPDLTKEV
jgi:chromosome segregation ATPase